MKQQEIVPSGPRVLAVVIHKGGVGKTTTAISLASALALLGKRVLLLDLDPQGNTTGGFGVDKAALPATVYDWLLGSADPEAILRTTDIKHLSLLPSNRDLVGAELELVGLEHREYLLSDRLRTVTPAYDFVFIDCPPSLGLLTVNALTAADGVLIPIQCEYFALEGVSELLSTIDRVRQNLNPNLEILGIIATMWDERTNLSRQVHEDIRSYFADKLFSVVVPRNVRLGEAPSYGKPIFLYDSRSRGAEAYLAIARELLARVTPVPEPATPGGLS
ncbi:MAG: AAA family ATPase [Thermoanaerobaculia bacterium]|nr:AAA family ATPase [Thermoanaerobaculia bacterium]